MRISDLRLRVCVELIAMESAPMVSIKENRFAYDVHNELPLPSNCVHPNESCLIQGTYRYYHYLCDGFDDRGWGCGYRTLQTMCSWLNFNTTAARADVPTLIEIQKVLVELEDKPPSFFCSREWIGSIEVCLVMDQMYNVASKIKHIERGTKLRGLAEVLREHFTKFGSPVMMGGDQDCSSKGILGVHIGSGDDVYFLILDPHFVGRNPTAKLLQNKGWVKWQHIDDFNESSFYNLCLPQIAIKS